jgi:hypothetical protein
MAHNSGALTPDRAATTTVVAPKALEVVAGDGSPALAPGMTPVAVSIGASSPQPQMGVASTAVVAGDDIVEEFEVV